MKSFTKKILYLIVSVVLIFSVCLYVTSHFTEGKGNQTENIQQEGNNPLSSGVMPSKIASNPNKQENEMATSNENNQKVKDVEKNVTQECQYLTKVDGLLDLVRQLRASAYTNCLQRMSTKELEAIWGIKIHEIDFYQLYINGRRTDSKDTESYQQELNKPYHHQPNDAYAVLRIHNKQFDSLEIMATKDYLRQYKGLNQWLPFKPDNQGWGMREIEISGDIGYKKSDLLPGFIEPSTNYYFPGDIRALVKVGFTVEALENNFVIEVGANIKNQ